MKGDLHQVLIQPLLTEKITALREQGNTVGFLVHPDANKIQIRQAWSPQVERSNPMFFAEIGRASCRERV